MHSKRSWTMKRFAIGFLIAVLGITVLAGIALASGGGSPPPQEGDTTEQGWLGVQIAGINERLVDHFHLTVTSGVVIVKVVPDGPADTAGLQAGDVIQAINGEVVSSVDQVTNAISALSPGAVVTLTILRGSEEVSIEATLAARPQPLVPSYLKRLLGQGLAGNILHAEYQILGGDGTVITVGLTRGQVQSISEAGLLTIVRKDGQDVEFSTTSDTKVIVGKHPINLSGLKEDTPVLVVEKDGAVMLVIGWPGDLLPHKQTVQRKSFQQHFRTDVPQMRLPGMRITPQLVIPQEFSRPDMETLKQRLQNLLPLPGLKQELREQTRQLWPDGRSGDSIPVIKPETLGKGDTM
ncbi:MAG: PDZ domain-containing protein [Dehalococcoidia bacterium]